MTYELSCQICGRDFTHTHQQTKTCSSNCRRLRASRISGRQSYFHDIATGTVGAISEIQVAADLMKRGFAVFRALSPACFCDIVASKGDIIMRIEARTGYLYEETGRISFQKHTNGPIDYFGVYLPANNSVAYFDTEYSPTELE